MPATVELYPSFAQQFLPGVVGKYNVPGIDQTPLGAFRLWSDWVLTPCSA
jgi:hypothetical protein